MKTIRLEVDDLFEDISKPSLSIIGPDYKVIVLYRDPRAIMTSITLRWSTCRLTPCWSVLDIWKINLEKSGSTNWIFSLSISNWISIAWVACKNQFRNWFLQAKNPALRTWFFQLDFSKIKYRSVGCWIMWFISSWEYNYCCYKLCKFSKVTQHGPGWKNCHFEWKQFYFFFSAWD